MKLKVLIALAVAAVLGTIYFIYRSSSSQSTHMDMKQSTTSSAPVAKNAVTIQNFAFSPASITVKTGTKVTWTNQDSPSHSATADDNSFDTGVLSTGQSNTVTFTKPGMYPYHCSIHPNMTGTVIVQ